METSMVNDRQSPADIQPDLRDQPAPSNLLLIDLDLLDDNPHQPRVERDEIKAMQLRDSIATEGQLQPILVRRVGARWQIIFGHGRVEALRRLHNDAKTEAERARFAKVRAEERCNVSDEQMLLLALLENIQREDISPVDCAAALMKLRSMRPELDTIGAIAGEARLEPAKVKRLLRLNAAPQVIKNAVSKGKAFVVPIGAEDSDPKLEHVEPEASLRTQEVRKLDLSSALALARLYAQWCEGGEDHSASEGSPDERMAALIDRVLTQEWGVRRVRLEVAKLAHGEADSPAVDDSPVKGEKDSLPFAVKRTKLVIFTSRLAQMDDAQKAQLKSVLDPICNQLGGSTQLAPTEDKGPLHWIGKVPQLRRDLKQMAQGCLKLWRIFLFYVVGKTPVDELPRSVQLPSYGDAHSKTRPVARLPSGATDAGAKAPMAVLPGGAAEPGAKATMSNGSEHRLGS